MRCSVRDHPRSRGEYPAGDKIRHPTLGSSPLSRGILVSMSSSLEEARIIPALAGNTPVEDRTGVGTRDHPRSRGEYTWVVTGEAIPEGSSPLSRGILNGVARDIYRIGIIPALAGNTKRRR